MTKILTDLSDSLIGHQILLDKLEHGESSSSNIRLLKLKIKYIEAAIRICRLANVIQL